VAPETEQTSEWLFNAALDCASRETKLVGKDSISKTEVTSVMLRTVWEFLRHGRAEG